MVAVIVPPMQPISTIRYGSETTIDIDLGDEPQVPCQFPAKSSMRICTSNVSDASSDFFPFLEYAINRIVFVPYSLNVSVFSFSADVDPSGNIHLF